MVVRRPSWSTVPTPRRTRTAAALHDGLNLADMAHVLDLDARGIVPARRGAALLPCCSDADATELADFPYDPAFGEPYNSRERFFVEPARRQRRLAARRPAAPGGGPRSRCGCTCGARSAELVQAAARFVAALAAPRPVEHVHTLMADQTYLQQAQPSTFGHYLLSFAYRCCATRDRLLEALAWINASPGGAGCVNGTRLSTTAQPLAGALGFDTRHRAHPRRDVADRRPDRRCSAAVASLVSTQSKLAEDLEIWSSSEFDFVDLADGYSRSSVLMPQKRNPYALSIVRGASGVLIGRLTGFLAVHKSPSARSDNLIFAYGEVPRALDLALRMTGLMAGVVRTLEVNAARMRERARRRVHARPPTWPSDLMQSCGVDYRTRLRGGRRRVREASRRGHAAARPHARDARRRGARA